MYLVAEDVQIIKSVGITIARTKKKMCLIDVSILNQANFSSTVVPLNSVNTLYYGLLFTLQAETWTFYNTASLLWSYLSQSSNILAISENTTHLFQVLNYEF